MGAMMVFKGTFVVKQPGSMLQGCLEGVLTVCRMVFIRGCFAVATRWPTNSRQTVSNRGLSWPGLMATAVARNVFPNAALWWSL